MSGYRRCPGWDSNRKPPECRYTNLLSTLSEYNSCLCVHVCRVFTYWCERGIRMYWEDVVACVELFHVLDIHVTSSDTVPESDNVSIITWNSERRSTEWEKLKWSSIVPLPITWPRDLRHELSSLARMLGSWVRIPLKAVMFVLCPFILCLCCFMCR
jgi:hypothetical protein